MSGDATNALIDALSDHFSATKDIVKHSQQALQVKDTIIDSLAQKNVDLQQKVEELQRSNKALSVQQALSKDRIYELETELFDVKRDRDDAEMEAEDYEQDKYAKTKQ